MPFVLPTVNCDATRCEDALELCDTATVMATRGGTPEGVTGGMVIVRTELGYTQQTHQPWWVRVERWGTIRTCHRCGMMPGAAAFTSTTSVHLRTDLAEAKGSGAMFIGRMVAGLCVRKLSACFALLEKEAQGTATPPRERPSSYPAPAGEQLGTHTTAYRR